MKNPDNALESTKRRLDALLRNFERELQSSDLRAKVQQLVTVFDELRMLGRGLIPTALARSARDRILHYFRKYPFIVISGKELMVVSGIQEWARRVRELRVQFGWNVVSGLTAKEMAVEAEFPLDSINPLSMHPEDYVLVNLEQDRDAAHRWNVANEIRKSQESVRDKILTFLRRNVGQKITGEELRYVAKDRTEWARRVRELRTEFGWPIVTKATGRPDLSVGVYLLEADRQSPEHDRRIPDDVRREVLQRDDYQCTECEWSYKEWNPADPRHLELHHVKHHVEGGENIASNLKTVCTFCHDDIHRKSAKKQGK